MQYSEQDFQLRQKLNKSVNRYIRIGLFACLLLTLLFTVVFLLVTEPSDGTPGTRFRYIFSGGYSYERTAGGSAPGTNLVFIAVLGVGVVGMLAWALLQKRLINFDAVPYPLGLHSASSRRKTAFVLSILLGFTGIDRFVLKNVLVGIAKMLLFFFAFGGVMVFFNNPEQLGAIVMFVVFVSAALFMWSVDIILIGYGAAKDDKGAYVR